MIGIAAMLDPSDSSEFSGGKGTFMYLLGVLLIVASQIIGAFLSLFSTSVFIYFSSFLSSFFESTNDN
jgi:hypothetical protein